MAKNHVPGFTSRAELGDWAELGVWAQVRSLNTYRVKQIKEEDQKLC